MSLPSLSFGFGNTTPPIFNEKDQPSHSFNRLYIYNNHQQQQRHKRRLNDTDEDSYKESSLPSSSNSSAPTSRLKGNHHRINKFKGKGSMALSKKHKTHEIKGEPLPLRRIVETLDHKSLQELAINLIERRPDVTQDVLDLSPKITVDQTFKILNDKMDEIINSLPYKVESTSDYSYLRVQKQVVEFFNSFSDYLLNFLSPVEEDITVTLRFLNEFLMNIFHKMPVFKNLEFRFFYDLSVEKLNLIFIDYLSKFLKANKSNILIIIKDDWFGIISQLNELNHFKFQKVYEFAKKEIDSFNEKGYYHIIDAEDEDEDGELSHRLTGLNGLINFSEENSPLYGTGSAIGDPYLL